MLEPISKLLLFLGALLLAVSLWKKGELPDRSATVPALLQEPVQQAVSLAPFGVSAGGIDYQIRPLYQYTLEGLVVSRHDTGAWWDYIHRDWNDFLNVVDLCVLWGENIRSQAYQHMKFSNGMFTCNFQAPSMDVFNAFNVAAISNNHLLTNKPQIAKAMRGVREGDQVRFKGYLAEYSHNKNGGFFRGTSTVRNDMGNGACETIWVEEFEVISRTSGPWPELIKLAWVMLGFGVIFWLLAPVRSRH